MALWEASDRICGKRLKVMIPALLPALERHGRLKLSETDRVLVLTVSAAIDRLLIHTKGRGVRGGAVAELVSIRRSAAQFRSAHSTIGTIRRRDFARST